MSFDTGGFDDFDIDGKKEQSSAINSFPLLVNGSHVARLSSLFIALHLLIVFVRPQNELGFLANIQFPFLISLLPMIMWVLHGVRQKWTPQMFAMLGFIIQGAILVPLVVNNRMAFEGWRVLLQLFLGVSFPIIAFCFNGAAIRRLWKLFLFVGVYWVFYSFTHAGRGPGDYLGDENDFGLAMIMMLGLAIGGFGITRSSFQKFIVFCVCIALVGGIVATASRGAFVGAACLTGYLIYKSNRKLLAIIVIAIIFAIGITLAPREYIDDIKSISNTNQGTAKERREYWKVAWAVFVDFDNIIWGVGMKNLPYRSGEYEPDENYNATGRSIAGRVAHSLYFTLLPELGLIGLALFLYMLWHSFVPNSRYQRQLKNLTLDLESFREDVVAADEAKKKRVYEKVKMPVLVDDYFYVIGKLSVEIKMLALLFLGLNAAWVGVLASGAFITVLYYPPIWLLAALSACAQIYFLRLQGFIEECSAEIKGVIQNSNQLSDGKFIE